MPSFSRVLLAAWLPIASACGPSEEVGTATRRPPAGSGGVAGKAMGAGGGPGSAAGLPAGQAGTGTGGKPAAGGGTGVGGNAGGIAGASGRAAGGSAAGAGFGDVTGVGAGAGGAAAGGAGGASGAVIGASGGAAAGGAPICAQQSAVATLVKRPLDLIVYLDTSASMKPAIEATEKNLETKLTATLAASGIDYRAIMLVGKKVPLAPADPARFSYVYGNGGSALMHHFILDWYDAPPADILQGQAGWSTYLRNDSFKVILVLSDTTSGPTMSAVDFDTALLAKSPAHFGTKDKRNYRYHAIMGVAQNVPKTAPWLPTDPLVGAKCVGFTNVSPNVNAQGEAIQTGGLRFPLCEVDAFDVVFQSIAQGEIDKAPVQCAFAIPLAPAGSVIDRATIEIRATSLTATATYSPVAGPADCKAERFYLQEKEVILCPEACAQVQADASAKVDVLYGCKLPQND